jgi:hypothetical protein
MITCLSEASDQILAETEPKSRKRTESKRSPRNRGSSWLMDKIAGNYFTSSPWLC